MKEGEKVYCIKDNTITYRGTYSNISGNVYKIYSIYKNDVFVSSEPSATTNGFYLFSYDEFYDHFVSLKEYRKIKLIRLKKLKIN